MTAYIARRILLAAFTLIPGGRAMNLTAQGPTGTKEPSP